jgi:hypothetical protein
MAATWTISELERQTANGGVIVAHWRVTDVDGEYSASAYGTASFTPDPTAPDFIPYDNLTEADVLGWVYTRLNKIAVEASLAGKIESDKNPVITAGLPW